MESTNTDPSANKALDELKKSMETRKEMFEEILQKHTMKVFISIHQALHHLASLMEMYNYQKDKDYNARLKELKLRYMNIEENVRSIMCSFKPPKTHFISSDEFYP